jgi:hypothetical protein
VFIEHPPENLMAFFNLTSVMLDEGKTFVFNSWVCIADSAGSFFVGTSSMT